MATLAPAEELRIGGFQARVPANLQVLSRVSLQIAAIRGDPSSSPDQAVAPDLCGCSFHISHGRIWSNSPGRPDERNPPPCAAGAPFIDRGRTGCSVTGLTKRTTIVADEDKEMTAEAYLTR